MFIDQTHSQFLLNGLSILRQDEELCDVELRAGDTKIFGHKVVLAAISDYFKAMFTGNMEESFVRTIYLHDIDEKSVAHLIDFAYSGHISININNVESLLISANILRVSKVISACSEFLVRQLHPSNCLGFLEFSDRLSLVELRRSCIEFAANNFMDLVQYDEFGYTGFQTIKALISNENINVSTEDYTFDFIEKWILFDKKNRIIYFNELFEEVNISMLSVASLVKLLSSSVTLNTDVSNLKLQYMLKMKRNPRRLNDVFYQNSLKHRRKSNSIIVMGGKDSYLNPLSTVSRFDINKNLWLPCKYLQRPRSSASATCLKGHIYLTGGTSDNETEGIHTKTVSCYSIKSNSWSTVCSMSQARSSHVTISHGNKLYAIGGYNGNTSLKSVECYDPVCDTWSEMASMNYKRSSFAAVVVDQYIFVLGGLNTATVERFDTRNGRWELMPAMSTKRLNFGAAQVCGFIYVVGGHDGREYLRSVERFDPVSSEWSVVRPMPGVRSGVGVAVAQHNIYVFGGHDGSRYLNTALKYDVFKDEWDPLPDMMNARCYMAATPVHIP